MRPGTGDALVIDAHCHIGPPLRGEELVAMMDEAGVDKAVVFPIPFLWTLPRKDNYYNTNDYIAEMQDRFPDRLIGFACINPRQTGDEALGMPDLAAGELERCVRDLGLRGVKLHPENHCFSVDSLCAGGGLSSSMEAIVRLQKETDRTIPVLSHGMTTLGAQPDQFARLAASYPDVSIIIAHGAGFQNLYFPSSNPIKEHANLYVDTAMCTVDDARLRGTAGSLGVERIIFGSDHFTRGHGNLYGNFFHVLERAFPDPEERGLILGGNMAGILGL